MVKKTLWLCGVGLFGLVLSGVADAQEVATLVLRNGERPSGELVDLNGSGFILRINGQEHPFATGDVTAVEFVGGAPTADAQAKITAGQQVVILRNGQVVEGRLSDIGGTRPLRLTVDTPSGPRDFTSSDVAQIYLSRGPSQAVSTTGTAPAQAAVAGSNAVTVPANQPWTDTGIIVARGERVQFSGSGDVHIAPNTSSSLGGNPAVTGRLPVANAPGGALIGRVGNGAPFLIGVNTQPIRMPANGRLMLGLNDDNVTDNNNASYSVTVSRLGR